MTFDVHEYRCNVPPRMPRHLALLPFALLALASPALAAPAPRAQDVLAALPGQVVGVSGSGDQLTLRLKSETQERALKIGDAYADGWILIGLNNSEVTLAKGAILRRIGLNPSGAVAQAVLEETPSQVRTLDGMLQTGAAANPALAAEQKETLAALDQRIAALETSTELDANETIGYLRIARATLLVSPQDQ
ncbi:MAG: hypothetical protein JWM33_630 [Caulobacteraceae bacterium]|nr:hypothetical protein [Caulobacteraceae bacterium]